MVQNEDLYKELEKNINFIDSKLKNSFQLVKKDIDSLKSLKEDVKKLDENIQKLREDLANLSLSKEKKTSENKEEKLQKEIEELKTKLEKERKDFEIVKEKQRAKYLAKIAYLKAKITDYKRLEKLKEEITSSIESNHNFLAGLESQRKKDVERFLKEKNEVIKFYESELKKIGDKNFAFQKHILDRVYTIEQKIDKSLEEFKKNIDITLRKNYEKLREENISFINQLYSKKKIVRKKEKNIFSKIVDSLADEPIEKNKSLKKEQQKKQNKKSFIDKIVDELAD